MEIVALQETSAALQLLTVKLDVNPALAPVMQTLVLSQQTELVVEVERKLVLEVVLAVRPGSNVLSYLVQLLTSITDCCSSGGFCGSSSDHCKAGCQSVFGECETNNISIDGQCGANGKTCTGSTFGSKYSLSICFPIS